MRTTADGDSHAKLLFTLWSHKSHGCVEGIGGLHYCIDLIKSEADSILFFYSLFLVVLFPPGGYLLHGLLLSVVWDRIADREVRGAYRAQWSGVIAHRMCGVGGSFSEGNGRICRRLATLDKVTPTICG